MGRTARTEPQCLYKGALYLLTFALYMGGRSSIRNPRTRHAVVTGIHLSRFCTDSSWLLANEDSKTFDATNREKNSRKFV